MANNVKANKCVTSLVQKLALKSTIYIVVNMKENAINVG